MPVRTKLLARTTLVLLIAIWPLAIAKAQTNEQLAARCAELGALYDRYNTRRGEGSGGPDLTRLGAGIDCQKGRYAQGIKALEGLLNGSRISYPPASY